MPVDLHSVRVAEVNHVADDAAAGVRGDGEAVAGDEHAGAEGDDVGVSGNDAALDAGAGLGDVVGLVTERLAGAGWVIPGRPDMLDLGDVGDAGAVADVLG